jgi:hypothetical protein
MNIEDVLDQIGEDVLPKDVKLGLTEAFADAVDIKVNSRLEVELTSALQKLDEDHTTKLNELIEAIDVDHTDKFTKVLERIDEDHAKKLQYYIDKQNTLLKEDAGAFKSQIVTQISNYLDLYLEEAIPKQEIVEAVANKQAQKALNEIKQILAIDDEYINDTIREAVSDGKQQIDLLKEQLNDAVKQNIKINQNLKGTRSVLMLEKASKDFTSDKRNYIMRTLSGKDPDFITENIDYVVKMFEKDEGANRYAVAKKAASESKIITEKVDVQSSKIVNTLNDAPAEAEGVSGYLQSLQGQDSLIG